MMNELRRLSTAIHPSNTPDVVLLSIHIILLFLRVVGAMDFLIGYLRYVPPMLLLFVSRGRIIRIDDSM